MCVIILTFQKKNRNNACKLRGRPFIQQIYTKYYHDKYLLYRRNHYIYRGINEAFPSEKGYRQLDSFSVESRARMVALELRQVIALR